MTPRQKLDSLVDLFAPEIRAAFISAIQDIVDNAILRQVIEAIESGDVERAFRSLGFSPAAMRPLTAALEKAFEQGGVMTGATFPRYLSTPMGKAVFRFDVRNSRAESWLRDRSSELVTRIEDETRVNVRNVLTDGMKAGRNPRSVALDIIGRIDQKGARTGGIVGLTGQQEFWVRSARTKLETLDSKYFGLELRDKRFDGTVRKAIESGKPLPSDIVDKLTTRYKANALRYRGETIGRTEAIHALNRSEWEATKQAVETGAVSASAVTRIWDSAGDTRVRWSHMRLDGQKVGLDETFRSPASGAMMMFPGDSSHGAPGGEVINCRCRVRTEIDWLSDLD